MTKKKSKLEESDSSKGSNVTDDEEVVYPEPEMNEAKK